MAQQPYKRDSDGTRLLCKGMNIMRPPDQMPVGKYPFLQNVRAYLGDRIAGRSSLDSSVLPLSHPVYSLRRLNDSTPNGPAGGFILVSATNAQVFAGITLVGSGFSGNPVSLLPFRPNASVQPWMYVGDSVKMVKVRSDGTTYKTGIAEPQVAPAVDFVPASDSVSLVGQVTAYIYNNPPQSHNPPLESVYIWKNASDPVGGSAVVETIGGANVVSTGSSLIFDNFGSNSDGSQPVPWTQYTTLVGSVNVTGTAVAWVSGDQFGGLTAGGAIVISGVTYTITGTPTNTSLNITASGGNQNSVNYSSSFISGTVPLFVPALESEGYQDFNISVVATLYIPTAGTYTMSLQVKDDVLWGIGNSANGTATWAKPSGGQTLSTIGQKLTTLNAYPLMPRVHETSGEDGFTTTASVAVTFSAAGNYPLEVDWNYWFHRPRGLVVQCNGADIPPLPPTVITQAQYRYIYRSSATGAKSNPSPESPEAAFSVIANNITVVGSADPQADKIDIFRLDAGLTNFTYVGTIDNTTATIFTTTSIPVTGIVTVQVGTAGHLLPGMSVTIDTGGNSEVVVLLTVTSGSPLHPASITAKFTKTHLAGVPITGGEQAFNDSLLDTDIAANPILEFDNFEPFPSIDLPRKGSVSVSAGTVAWLSGDKFNIRWLPGTVIIIGTTAFTLNKRPTSTTALTATNTSNVGGVQTIVLPPNSANVSYEISEPTLAAQPLPYLWGPTDNVSFFFAVGDPLRPGTLYWSKGNNPDSAPDTNQQDVTSPSEPLQNGCIVNGVGWVASTERAWLIYPNFFNALATVQGTVGATWTLQESSLKRGLYLPRCLAVDGGGNVYFRAKDGIYVSPGGQGGHSITDDDLFNLFPHEGSDPIAVTRGGYTVFPPDDVNRPQAQQMNIANGYLYYDYEDITGTPRTLVYDIQAGGWVVDVYQDPVVLHVLEEGVVNGVLCGCVSGNVKPLTNGVGEVACAIVLMPCMNGGDTRAEKKWGDLYIEAETVVL